jgi:hypothetical protein
VPAKVVELTPKTWSIGIISFLTTVPTVRVSYVCVRGNSPFRPEILGA